MTRILIACLALFFVSGAFSAVPANAYDDAPFVPVPPKPGENRHPDQMENNRKLCEKSDGEACAFYGDAIYVTALEGGLTNKMSAQEVAAMTAKGYQFKEQGCLLGHAYTCSALGYAYQYGHGVGIDNSRAYGFFAIACVDLPEYCKNRDELAAFASLAAIRMAKLRSEAQPLPPKAMPRTAEKLDQLKDPEYLHTMGGNAYSKRDFKAARDYYNQACLAGRAASCGYIGLLYHDAMGGTKDFKKSFPLFKKACEANDGFFCKYLGDAYAKGEGTKVNVKTARKFYQKACGLNDQMGCALAK
jgi:TPR repeat protein